MAKPKFGFLFNRAKNNNKLMKINIDEWTADIYFIENLNLYSI